MDECKCLGILQNNGGALQLSFSCIPPSHGVHDAVYWAIS